MPVRRSSMVVVLITAPVLFACRTDSPVDQGEMPYAFLGGRVEEAQTRVEEARAALQEEPAGDALGPLGDASVVMRKVLDYYLPLLETRFHVARAAGIAATSPDEGRAALDPARAILERIASSHGEHLSREMQEPLAQLEAARTAIDAGESEEARRTLERLLEQLDVLYFRGELVLEGSTLDSPATPPPD